MPIQRIYCTRALPVAHGLHDLTPPRRAPKRCCSACVIAGQHHVRSDASLKKAFARGREAHASRDLLSPLIGARPHLHLMVRRHAPVEKANARGAGRRAMLLICSSRRRAAVELKAQPRRSCASRASWRCSSESANALQLQQHPARSCSRTRSKCPSLTAPFCSSRRRAVRCPRHIAVRGGISHKRQK